MNARTSDNPACAHLQPAWRASSTPGRRPRSSRPAACFVRGHAANPTRLLSPPPQVCRFCWHRIRNDENGLCPACRKEYSDKPAEYCPMTMEDVQKCVRLPPLLRNTARRARATSLLLLARAPQARLARQRVCCACADRPVLLRPANCLLTCAGCAPKRNRKSSRKRPRKWSSASRWQTCGSCRRTWSM